MERNADEAKTAAPSGDWCEAGQLIIYIQSHILVAVSVVDIQLSSSLSAVHLCHFHHLHLCLLSKLCLFLLFLPSLCVLMWSDRKTSMFEIFGPLQPCLTASVMCSVTLTKKLSKLHAFTLQTEKTVKNL